jgi:hypothetical protein
MGREREKRGSYRRRREFTTQERDKAEAINANEIKIKAEAFIAERLGEKQLNKPDVVTERKIWVSRPTQVLPSLKSIFLHHTAYLAGLALKEIKAEHKDNYMPENGDEE